MSNWRVGAREDEERKVCDGPQKIHPSIKQDRRRFYKSNRTNQLKDAILQNSKTRIV